MLAWITRLFRLLRAAGRLADLEHRLRTQDNHATAWPLYVVQEQERIYGLDPEYADAMSTYIWQYRDDPEYFHETDDELRAEFPDEPHRDWEPFTVSVTMDGAVWEKIFYASRWRFVCAHLTEDAADTYIAQNRHNLTNPRVYVTSQHRCYEWHGVMQILGAPHG